MFLLDLKRQEMMVFWDAVAISLTQIHIISRFHYPF